MTSAALIVGIDAYKTQPLTSAVRDAESFRDVLIELGLVAEQDIRLLRAPAVDQAELPTRRRILDELLPFYTRKKIVDRLFVHYAGHGLLAFSDAARSLPRTALVPVDVDDLDENGDLLIDLDSVLSRLRFSGPDEQFFFIDACRNLAYEEHPDATTALGWKAQPLGAERKQAIFYAVPPLGQAQGERDGRGVMTQHLIEALRGRGIALDYSDELRSYVVSPESVAAYVKKRVFEAVGPVPLWKLKYSLPTLDHREPKTGPIRVVASPPDAEITVFVDPSEAQDVTNVELTQMDLAVCSWPPNAYSRPFSVKPRRYWLEANSSAGTPEPVQMRIDVREEREARIVIRPPGEQILQMRSPGEPGPSAPKVLTRPDDRTFFREPEPGAVIRASALEAQAIVELEQLDPPYTRWTSRHDLKRTVQPGPYRIRFRLGPDVYSESELDIRDRSVVDVTPTIGASPLLQDMLDVYEPPTDAIISETIGPIQAGVLQTMLPILGIKAFDTTGELFHRFDSLVPYLDPSDYRPRPMSIVVAVDGNRWEVPWTDILASIRCDTEYDGELQEFRLQAIPNGRIGLAVGTAPGTSFLVRIESPHLGSVRASVGSVAERATVVSLAVRPDGSFDFAQNVLRIPGVEYQEPVPRVQYGRMVRQMQLGQKLYESGELVEQWSNGDEFRELFEAKWTDPILSCMAYYAWIDAGRPDGVGDPQQVVDNLVEYFPDLPDTQVVYGLEHEDKREQIFSELLDGHALPVLARTSRQLASYAEARGRTDDPIVSLTRRIAANQPWSLRWEAHSDKTPVRQVATT